MTRDRTTSDVPTLSQTSSLEWEHHSSEPNETKIPPAQGVELQDPIIQNMLNELGRSPDDVEGDELERLIRMCSMLKHSKRYKRSLIQSANQRWGVSDAEGPLIIGNDVWDALTCVDTSSFDSPPSRSSKTTRKPRKVSFSDKLLVFQLSSHSMDILAERIDERKKGIKGHSLAQIFKQVFSRAFFVPKGV